MREKLKQPQKEQKFYLHHAIFNFNPPSVTVSEILMNLQAFPRKTFIPFVVKKTQLKIY